MTLTSAGASRPAKFNFLMQIFKSYILAMASGSMAYRPGRGWI
jgi:hypothetical protein